MQRMRLGQRAVILSIGLGAAALSLTFTSGAKVPPVTVGKISSQKPAPAELTQEIKTTMEEEIAGMDLSAAKGKYVLSGSLVDLDTKTSGNQVESTCIISAELAQQKGGRLEAVFRGKAKAVDGKNAAKSAELAALKAAMKSAVQRLPEAVH